MPVLSPQPVIKPAPLVTGIGAPTMNFDGPTLPTKWRFQHPGTPQWYMRAGLLRSAFGTGAFETDASDNPLGLLCEGFLYGYTNNTNVGIAVANLTNLFTDGNFAADPFANGWTQNVNGGTGSVTWNGTDTVTLLGDGTHAAQLGSMAIPVVNGHVYIITATLSSNTSLSVGTTQYGSNILNTTQNVGWPMCFTAAATTTYYITWSRTGAVSTTIKNAVVYDGGKLPDFMGWVTGLGTVCYSIQQTSTFGDAPCFDLRLFGTTSSVGAELGSNSNAISASASDTFSTQAFLAYVAGSLTNYTNTQLIMRWPGGGTVVYGPGLALTGTMQQTKYEGVSAPVGTTGAKGGFLFSWVNGAALDITIRICGPFPQREAFCSSPVFGDGNMAPPTSRAGTVCRLDNADAAFLTPSGFTACLAFTAPRHTEQAGGGIFLVESMSGTRSSIQVTFDAGNTATLRLEFNGVAQTVSQALGAAGTLQRIAFTFDPANGRTLFSVNGQAPATVTYNQPWNTMTRIEIGYQTDYVPVVNSVIHARKLFTRPYAMNASDLVNLGS